MSHPRSASRRPVRAPSPWRGSAWFARATTLVTLAMLLAGCPAPPSGTPSAIYEPTVVGVVDHWEEIESGGLLVTFIDGRQVTTAVGANVIVGRNLPIQTDLLLLDSQDRAPWFAAIRDTDLGCYALDEPAVDDGTHILFDIGLRLRKAPGFDPGAVDDGRFGARRESFCINAAGEVVGYGTGVP